MTRFLKTEAGATVLWLLGTMLCGAVFLPWLYRGGMFLAEMDAREQVPRAFEWLAEACARSLDKYGRYFNRALLISALLLLPLLFARIRRIRLARGGRLPRRAASLTWGQAGGHFMAGFAVALFCCAILAAMLVSGGAFILKEPGPGIGKLLSKTVPPMLGAALVEEWIFRGLLLSLWLAVTKPKMAAAGCSLMFAFLHFLTPPNGVTVSNPTGIFAGFELLADVLVHFTNPLFFVTDFATLLLLGLVLCWARIRTGALWLGIGIHAALVGSLKAFNLLADKVDHHAWSPWGVGETLRSGIFPLLMISLIALLTGSFLRLLPLPLAAHDGDDGDFPDAGPA